MSGIIDYAIWEITTKCNLNCLHCIRKVYPGELDSKDCLRVIDSLGSLGCRELSVTGGEIFVKKGLLEILEYANKKGIKIKLFTNGVLINKKVLERLKFIECIYFSIEGPESVNDFIRGKGVFRKVIKDIELCKDLGINFGIASTLNKLNFDNLESFLAFLKKLRPKYITLSQLIPLGKAKKNKSLLYQEINKKSLINLMRKVFPNKKFRKLTFCPVNPRQIFIDPKGNFYPCTEVCKPGYSNALGNLLNKNYLPILIRFNKKKVRPPKKCPYLNYGSENITFSIIQSRYCSINNLYIG